MSRRHTTTMMTTTTRTTTATAAAPRGGRRHHRRRAIGLALLLAAAPLLGGCFGGDDEPPPPPPPPPPPTVVRLTLTALPGVNPDPTGRASPIAVTVYQLSRTQAFNEADFFQLQRDAAGTLGDELIAQTSYVLAPGEVKLFERELKPEEKFIGVVAAYRDIGRANWRAAAPVPPMRTTNLSALLDSNAVRLVEVAE